VVGEIDLFFEVDIDGHSRSKVINFIFIDNTISEL
jgi:hypothetical protein